MQPSPPAANVGTSFRHEEPIGADCQKWVLVGRQAADTEPVFVRLAGASEPTVGSGCRDQLSEVRGNATDRTIRTEPTYVS
jgi:hypothetical protein